MGSGVRRVKTEKGQPDIVAAADAASRLHHGRGRRMVSKVMPLYRKTVGKVANTLFLMDLIDSTNGFRDIRWMGQPIWQDIIDLWSFQEVLYEVKPDLLIECGTFQGGSSLFFANLMDIMGKGEVITLDIHKQHDLSHPRITYLYGKSSADPEFVEIVHERAAKAETVMVMLDSHHAEDHVWAELNAYAPMVTVGSRILVQDGIIDTLDIPAYRKMRPGPLPAIKRWLAEHPEFELDEERNHRFPVTFHPMGWMKRVR